MATEIPREHVLGNFKPSKSARLKAKRTKKPAAAKRPGMSEDHLVDVRKLPCCACLKVPSGEAHHLKNGTNERGAGMRSTDKWAVPLCRDHHEEIERVGSRNEPAQFEKWGFDDALQLASDLWRSRGDVPKMTLIVLAHRRACR
jgi:hypothetical protein